MVSSKRYGAGGGQRATSSGGYVQGVISSETWNARDTLDIHRGPQQLSLRQAGPEAGSGS